MQPAKNAKDTKELIRNELEDMHLDTAKRRRDELRAGKVQPIDGEEALARVRRLVKK